MRKILFVTFLWITTIAFSQESFVINNVRLFNGETVQQNMSVLVENGRIAKISSVKIDNDSIIDGTGKTLLPAMTNSHVHVWSAFSLLQAAQAGVLNLLDMHAMEMVIPQLKALRSSTNYADYYCAGAAATVPKGHGTQYGFPTPTLTKPEEAKAFVTARIAAGAHYIKIIKEPWKSTLNDSTVAAIIKEAHKQDRKAVVHISKVKDGYQILKAKADGLVHIWDDKTLSNKELNDLKDEKFFVVPTLLTIQNIGKMYSKKSPEKLQEKMKMVKNEVKRLYDIGVPILAGTDPPNAKINYGNDLFKELILLQEAGIPILEVLKSATSLPAIHFNLKEKGFIKEGYRADLVLVDGNPTENLNDLNNKKRVFKLGKEVSQ